MARRLEVPTDPSAIAVIERQVEVMFVLASESLGGVGLDECLWVADPASWTVHSRNDRWFGELGEETPGMATPSLAWTMWHPIWWLETLLAHSQGHAVPAPESVEWPGPDAALRVLRERWGEWMIFVRSLDEADLASSELTRFPYDDDRPLIHIVGWASMEMVKNLSEMCLQRRLQAPPSRPSLGNIERG